MQSFRDLGTHLDLIPAAINRQLSEIDIGRGRQEAFARQYPATLESLMEVALIQSVEASNAIENITAPRKRLEQLVAQKATPRNRSEAEIAGYRAVLDTIHSSALHIPFTPNVVRQLHRDLYQFAAQPGGNWKNTDNRVTEQRPDGSVAVRFTPVASFETPRAIDELHEHFNEAWNADHHHRLLLAAAYTLDFLIIHPFADGNGRISRVRAARPGNHQRARLQGGARQELRPLLISAIRAARDTSASSRVWGFSHATRRAIGLASRRHLGWIALPARLPARQIPPAPSLPHNHRVSGAR